jgi:response regulator of citrate/malate metabolism
MDGYLMKPVSLTNLKTALREVHARRAALHELMSVSN